MLNVSIRDAAALAGVNLETARRWAHAGMGYRVGKGWRICAFKLDRKLHGLPLDPIPDQELAALLRQAADAIEDGGNEFAKPLALVVGEITAWFRGERIREEAAMASDRETANARTGGVAS